jgi:HTH-type transcriptional regulator/antitoxin HigA
MKDENRVFKILKNEIEYNNALSRIEIIQDVEINTPEGDELELLALLIQDYEEKHFPLPDPDPIEVIQFYIEQFGLKAKDLIGVIGDKALVSKILNKQRKLNLRMIRNIHTRFNIPYELLIVDYSCNKIK